MTIVISVLKEILKAVLVSLVTKQFIKEVVIYALRKLVKHTDNNVDNELVDMVEKALNTNPEQTEQK